MQAVVTAQKHRVEACERRLALNYLSRDNWVARCGRLEDELRDRSSLVAQLRKKLNHEVATVKHLQWRINHQQNRQTILEAYLDYAYASHAPGKDLTLPKVTASPKDSDWGEGQLRIPPFPSRIQTNIPVGNLPECPPHRESLRSYSHHSPQFRRCILRKLLVRRSLRSSYILSMTAKVGTVRWCGRPWLSRGLLITATLWLQNLYLWRSPNGVLVSRPSSIRFSLRVIRSPRPPHLWPWGLHSPQQFR